MKISARNVLDGTVKAVKLGAVNSEVDVDLPGGLGIVATVTNDSVTELGLTAGKPVKVLVKASSVLVLADGSGIRLSARNRLEGVVSGLTDGPVSAAVAIALPNGTTVFATITHEGAVALGLTPGLPVAAIFKASAVILGVSV